MRPHSVPSSQDGSPTVGGADVGGGVCGDDADMDMDVDVDVDVDADDADVLGVGEGTTVVATVGPDDAVALVEPVPRTEACWEQPAAETSTATTKPATPVLMSRP